MNLTRMVATAPRGVGGDEATVWITGCWFRSLLFIPVDSGISVVSCVNVFPSEPDCSD